MQCKGKKQLFSSSITLDIGSNSRFFKINLQETTLIFMQKINCYFRNLGMLDHHHPKS